MQALERVEHLSEDVGTTADHNPVSLEQAESLRLAAIGRVLGTGGLSFNDLDPKHHEPLAKNGVYDSEKKGLDNSPPRKERFSTQEDLIKAHQELLETRLQIVMLLLDKHGRDFDSLSRKTYENICKVLKLDAVETQSIPARAEQVMHAVEGAPACRTELAIAEDFWNSLNGNNDLLDNISKWLEHLPFTDKNSDFLKHINNSPDVISTAASWFWQLHSRD